MTALTQANQVGSIVRFGHRSEFPKGALVVNGQARSHFNAAIVAATVLLSYHLGTHFQPAFAPVGFRPAHVVGATTPLANNWLCTMAWAKSRYPAPHKLGELCALQHPDARRPPRPA